MALSVDGSATNTTAASNACTVTLTTSNANDIIALWARSAGTASAVSSVSGGGLTWNLRKAILRGTSVSLELWWALAASPLSSTVITTNFVGSNGANRLTAFGVTGANTTTPFDTDASLPASAQSASSQSEAPTISTQNSNTMLIAGLTALGGFTSLTYPGGFAQILATGTVNDYSKSVISSALSSVTETFSWSAAASENILILDAIQQAAGAAGVFNPYYYHQHIGAAHV